jgi:hypothetical protein
MERPLTELQIRFQLELEGRSLPDECIRELAEDGACRRFEVEGKTQMIVNREGLEILMRYSPNPEAVEALKHTFPE